MNEHTHHHDASTPDEAEASDAETRDPVCGMKESSPSPVIAAAAMSFGPASVVGNALRLRGAKS